MKKYLLFLLAFVPMVFAACSSDDNMKEEKLVGTVWEYIEYSKENKQKIESISTLTFISESKVKFTAVEYDDHTEGGKKTVEQTTDYHYANHVITIKIEHYILTGKISGNKMTVEQKDPEDEKNTTTVVLTKKK